MVRHAGLLALVALVSGACASARDDAASHAASAPLRCDAEAAGRDLIGSHVGAVMFAPDANVRVVCTTCATTRDYRPDRLNVWFDQQTGIIQRTTCG